MKYAIFYKRLASKELLELPIKIAFKLKAAIDNLSENQRPPNCTKLEGSLDEYRIRIGKYRMIVTDHPL